MFISNIVYFYLCPEYFYGFCTPWFSNTIRISTGVVSAQFQGICNNACIVMFHPWKLPQCMGLKQRVTPEYEDTSFSLITRRRLDNFGGHANYPKTAAFQLLWPVSYAAVLWYCYTTTAAFPLLGPVS